MVVKWPLISLHTFFETPSTFDLKHLTEYAYIPKFCTIFGYTSFIGPAFDNMSNKPGFDET